MIVSFKQIRGNKDIAEKEGFGTIVLSSLIITGFAVYMVKQLNIDPLITGLSMLALVWLGRPLSRKLFGDFVKKSDVIGELKFNSTTITSIKDNSIQDIQCTEINSMHLTYNYIQGKQFASKDIIHNGLALLTIQTSTNQTYNLKFLIESEKQLNELKPIWKEYYKQKIKIRESMGKYEVKTILFETYNLSYEKIQKLKKELNVESFY